MWANEQTKIILCKTERWGGVLGQNNAFRDLNVERPPVVLTSALDPEWITFCVGYS